MKNKLFNKILLAFVPFFLAFVLSGCPKKQLVKKTTPTPQEAEVKILDSVESQELDIHGKEFEESSRVEKVYFEFDSSELSQEARQKLFANATLLKKNKAMEFVIQGHCDERGTVAYNLALGQKRAQAVRQYYIALGLDPKKIGTLSLGEEAPECNESNEECWAKNRKGETLVPSLKGS